MTLENLKKQRQVHETALDLMRSGKMKLRSSPKGEGDITAEAISACEDAIFLIDAQMTALS